MRKSVKILIVLLAILGFGWISSDYLQGRMFAMFAGTTVDPRTALGKRNFGTSMEPRLITYRDRKYPLVAPNGIEYGQHGQTVTFAIPEAYLTNIRSEKEGWFGSRVTSFAISASTPDMKPYRSELRRLRKEFLETSNIELITGDERAKLDNRRCPGFCKAKIHFPSIEWRNKFESWLESIGFSEIAIAIGSRPVSENRRRYRLLSRTFNVKEFGNDPEKLLKTSQNCIKELGPWPNSTQYRIVPEHRASRPSGALLSDTCIYKFSTKQNPYAILTLNDDETVKYTTLCVSPLNPKSREGYRCDTDFMWQEIWGGGIFCL